MRQLYLRFYEFTAVFHFSHIGVTVQQNLLHFNLLKRASVNGHLLHIALGSLTRQGPLFTDKYLHFCNEVQFVHLSLATASN